MSAWWDGLTLLNQICYGAAAFFSVLFLWQMLAAFLGMGGDGADADTADGDVGGLHMDAGGHDVAHPEHADADATGVSFALISVRSLITFFTLFTWGAALYLNRKETVSAAMGWSALWGFAGMFGVAAMIYGLRKLTATGTADLNTCLGTDGTVYLDIPAQGTGEVRVSVSGVVSYVKARGADGMAIKAGTPVRVVRRVAKTLLEVEPIVSAK